MIDNKQIEERKKKKKKRRKASVIAQMILILLVFLAVLYGLFATHPEWTGGQFDWAVPSILKERIPPYRSDAPATPEPTRLATPTPEAEETPLPTPSATPTPEPTPTIDPAIEAIRLPSYDTHDLSEWNLVLVNAEHPIPEDYTFRLVYVDPNNEFAVDARIADPLLRMLEDCAAEGHTPIICSAYRDPTTQSYLFEEDELEQEIQHSSAAEDTAEPETAAYSEVTASVAVPGSSEHEIGIAVDIYSEENMELDESQEDTDTQKWLMAHCWEYGFILRYPKEKADLTGIIYEPWHYRYVGVDVATDIRESGLCFEEYIANMKKVKEYEDGRTTG